MSFSRYLAGRLIAAVCFSSTITWGSLWAQEADSAPVPVPPAEAASDAAAESAEPVRESPQEGSPIEAYQTAFAQWKDLIKELRALRVEFREAKPQGVADIQRRWDEKMAEGEVLLTRLKETGGRAFEAAPNADPQLVAFLVKLAKDDVEHDNYEPALALARILLENDCKDPGLYAAGGIAAFATNDFDFAEKYLKKAEQEGVLKDAAVGYLYEIPKYRELWQQEEEAREKEAKADDLPRVLMKTSQGDILIELFENEAPDTVGNFVSLVEQGFYDGLTFHRVLEGFMAQAGCPNGDGTGGAGYNIPCECYRDDARSHFRGTLSMAHAGKDTGSSQFFLTFLPTPHLNGRHTVFGRVIEGMDVLAKLKRIDPQEGGAGLEPDKIEEATVTRKREHEYKPAKAP